MDNPKIIIATSLVDVEKNKSIPITLTNLASKKTGLNLFALPDLFDKSEFDEKLGFYVIKK